MKYLLSLFLIIFSMVSYAAEVKIIRGAEEKKPTPQFIDITKEKAQPPKPKVTKKQNLQEIIALTVNHCLKIENVITEHSRLVRGFNSPLENDILLPDLGFVFGQEWSVTPRILRTKFNSVLLLSLSEKLGFKFGGLPFHGNCTAKLASKITHQDKFYYAQVETPLAFNFVQAKLLYHLTKQEGYNWIISDILVNGESLKTYNSGNVQNTIYSLCKKSGFGTLQCD